MELEKHVRITKTGYAEGTLDKIKLTDEQTLMYRSDTAAYNDLMQRKK